MYKIEIVKEGEAVSVKFNTKELPGEEAIMMALGTYITICDECDVNPIELLVNALDSM